MKEIILLALVMGGGPSWAAPACTTEVKQAAIAVATINHPGMDIVAQDPSLDSQTGDNSTYTVTIRQVSGGQPGCGIDWYEIEADSACSIKRLEAQ